MCALHECLPIHAADVYDLNTFVTIALSTATGGEDALTQDKLSNIRTAGSGYGPLLYSLQSTAGFQELSNCCTYVWKVLETKPDLPIILVSYSNVCISWNPVHVIFYGTPERMVAWSTLTGTNT